jgi:hypothetical protein
MNGIMWIHCKCPNDMAACQNMFWKATLLAGICYEHIHFSSLLTLRGSLAMFSGAISKLILSQMDKQWWFPGFFASGLSSLHAIMQAFCCDLPWGKLFYCCLNQIRLCQHAPWICPHVFVHGWVALIFSWFGPSVVYFRAAAAISMMFCHFNTYLYHLKCGEYAPLCCIYMCFKSCENRLSFHKVTTSHLVAGVIVCNFAATNHRAQIGQYVTILLETCRDYPVMSYLLALKLGWWFNLYMQKSGA